MTALDVLEVLSDGHQFYADSLTMERFVISSALLGIMDRRDVVQSVNALIEADMCVLPFPQMVVEFQYTDMLVHFVQIRQAIDIWQVRHAFIHRGGKLASIMDDWADMAIRDGQIVALSRMQDTDAPVISLALALALLLTNVRGVDLTPVDNSKINKARARSGNKPPKPDYTAVRIGKIHQGARGKGAGRQGMRQPVHFRAGYTRTVHYGPDKSLTRLDYVPPCIVNFEGEAPRPRERRTQIRRSSSSDL